MPTHTLHELTKMVRFIKDNSITKKEFDERLDKIETDVKNIKTDITAIRSDMVTRNYLDTQLMAYKDKATDVVREEDQKLTTLVHTLHGKDVLTDDEQKKFLAMKPFPQTI